ncbi:outer membrane lipoprotein carrier protein LolA [Cellulomonas sp. NPDC058312]|uniref:LolA family protein n=1 Tax=Cellulomonas sp. NPDC058312 TaxID=3346441 RepID=UPI0036EE0538
MSESTPRPRRTLSPRARWAVPGVVVAAVAAAVGVPALASADGAGLPDVTAEQLLSRVASAEPTPVQGTVVYTARLGLPELPISEMTGADPLNLLGGSSTLRVWSDGADRSRVSLLGATSEYSVVRDGAQAWTYSSTDDAVTHLALDPADQARYDALAEQARSGALVPEGADLPTPEQAAAQVLARAEQDSDVTVDRPTTVAGRDAYQLVVSPTDDATLVSRVVVAVDAATSAPLRVQVWAVQDGDAPSLEVGFTDVAFTAPDDSVLAFSAPAGATTEEVVVPLPDVDEAALAERSGVPALPEGVTVAGSGWSTVVSLADVDVAGLVGGDPASLGTVPGSERVLGSEAAQDLIGEFVPSDEDGRPARPELDGTALYEQLTTEVPEGRLLSSTLLSVLVTDDGRVLVGAVPADTLRAAA